MASAKPIKLSTQDGQKLFAQYWGDPREARAVIILVHGLGEHILRYEYVAQKLNERSFLVLGYDQRGHGQTPGKRGLIGPGGVLMDDISTAIQAGRELCPGRPLFLYGHSMGAAEVLYYGLKGSQHVDGVIATSPPLYLSPATAKKRGFAKFAAKILPELTVNNGLETYGLSRDKAVVEDYLKDPLVHPMASVRLANTLFDISEYALENAKAWRLPLFLAHGTDDPICDVRGSDQFAQNAGGEITYKRWDGLYHETHNEQNKDAVIAAMIDWLETQIRNGDAFFKS